MSRFCVQATWDDVPHLTEEQKKALWDAIPPHQRDARTKGIPVLGSGKVFPIDEETIKAPQREIPDEWARLIGVDFGGWDHPFSAVEIAHDREADVVYVTKVYRIKDPSHIIHAAAIKPWGDWIPIAWPHDGNNGADRASGKTMYELYEDQGLNMLPHHATFEEGGYGLETGIMMVLGRMQTGRLKVFSHHEELFEELRLYHRKDGKIVRIKDDVLDAMRVAVMMLRYAETKPRENTEEYGGYGAGSWMG